VHYCEISIASSSTYSQDPHFDKALQGIENLQKLTSSDLEDTASLGRDSELEDEGEDILVAGGLEGALEVNRLHLLSLIPRPHPSGLGTMLTSVLLYDSILDVYPLLNRH